jgi:antitoxin component of MazEF toxin-antitoxin module
MVVIGRSKFGQNNRISLVEGLPELLNLEIGDYVLFEIEGGELIIRKDTRKYRGFDFEGEEIKKRLMKIEEDRAGEDYDSDMDPDEVERIAREEYERDMKLKNNGKR